MEDGDTATHASQRECKTYRGCQSSGVTDSDSERQHEINMAVQTVQGRGQTDCQEGGTDRHALAQSHIRMPPLPEHHTSVHCWGGLHSAMQDFTPTHSLTFTRTQNPAVHTLSTHTPPAAAHPPTQLDTQVCWHIQTEILSTLTPAQVRSQHQLPGHR